MKKILALALVLMLPAAGAFAAVLTDVPATPAKAAGVQITASWADGTAADELQALDADEVTVAQAQAAYAYVYEGNNSAASWYPEETRQEIAGMVSTDAADLGMSNMLRLHVADGEPQSDLNATIDPGVAYQADQQVVVVLGDTTGADGIDWTTVAATVNANGRIEFTVPQSVLALLQGKDLIFTVMSTRSVTREVVNTESEPVFETEAPAEDEGTPSVDAESTTSVARTVKNGQVVEDDFKLVIVEETTEIRQEIELIKTYVSANAQPALTWLPEDAQQSVAYLLGNDGSDLIVSDYVTLTSENFVSGDGSAVGTFSFATPYTAGRKLVAALGLPKADAAAGETQMSWTVMPASVNENGCVDVVFDQQVLDEMGSETGLLLIFSEAAE